jgi:hypothetical protein
VLAGLSGRGSRRLEGRGAVFAVEVEWTAVCAGGQVH